jgi:hypothetical protein
MLGIAFALVLAVLGAANGHGYTPSAADTAAGGSLFIGVITMLIWSRKGGSKLVGFLWGFFLSLIGLIVVMAATPSAAKQARP